MTTLLACGGGSLNLTADAGGGEGGNGGSTATPDGGTPGVGGSSLAGHAGSTGAGGFIGSGGIIGGGGVVGSGGDSGGSGGAVACPAIACAPTPGPCPFGVQKDAQGCPTCQCATAMDCPAGSCGAIDFLVAKCADGSTPVPMCQAGGGPVNGCHWVIPSCPVACPGVTCNLACFYGHATDANGCALCKCLPAPTCAADQCGPPPPVAACPGGGGPKVTCQARGDIPGCAWVVDACPMPAACTPAECGPGPKVASRMCADGSVAGPTCTRSPEGKCGWTVTTCPSTAADACTGVQDFKTCNATTGCQWLQPGCAEPALQLAGCYSTKDIGCTGDASCGGGRQCLKRIVDPCFNPTVAVTCSACGASVTVCL